MRFSRIMMAKSKISMLIILSMLVLAQAVSLPNFFRSSNNFESLASGINLQPQPRDNRPKRQSYVFPQGVEHFIPEIRIEFSCENRGFGYYADVANYCQIFHVCSPGTGQQFSFFCPNQTIFDQRLLVCEQEEMATPCEDAANYYGINQYFGTVQVEPSA